METFLKNLSFNKYIFIKTNNRNFVPFSFNKLFDTLIMKKIFINISFFFVFIYNLIINNY